MSSLNHRNAYHRTCVIFGLWRSHGWTNVPHVFMLREVALGPSIRSEHPGFSIEPQQVPMRFTGTGIAHTAMKELSQPWSG